MSERGRILVIDDDLFIRQFFTFFLRRKGYEVEVAEDGRTGMEMMRRLQPDMVLCDVRMPGVDGLDVLAAAKQDLPFTPVIMMSGAGRLDDAIGALKLGAWDYLRKPFNDLAALENALQRAEEKAALLRENDRYRRNLEKSNRELRTTLKLLEEDEEAGRLIQFRLLPEDGRLGEYEFSRDLVPSAHLSGDFVDYFEIDDAHLGFYLADVAGHGVSSAFVTVFIKSFIQQLRDRLADSGSREILSPRLTLEGLNRQMLRERMGKHVTICYGVIETSTNQLTYSSAGQFPFPILRDGTEARFLPGKGLPVGLFEFARYPQRKLVLPVEFTLALWSDGVLEVVDGLELEAKGGSLLRLMSEPPASAEVLHETVGVREHTPLPDDVTLLLVRRGETHGLQR